MSDESLIADFKSLLELERASTGRAIDAKLEDFRRSMDEKWRSFLQKNSHPPGGFSDRRTPETLGSVFLESRQYKHFRETGQQRSGKFALSALEGKAALIAPPFPVRAARTDPSPNVYPANTLRSVLNPIPIAEGAIEYLRQKPTAGSAAVQHPQGSLKAELSVDFELATANIVTVAGWCQVSRQVLADDSQVRAMIDDEVMFQVMLAEEKEILNGPGGAGHMEGLLTLAPAFAGAASGDTAIDIIGKAQGAIAALGYPVSATVVNPADWTLMQQVKTGDGTYVIGNPGQGATAPYLWNVPLIPSSNITAGNFLTGAFGTAARLYDREYLLEVSLEDRDNFIKNMATILGEVRSALVVRRPAGFLKGSLVAPAGAREATEAKPGVKR